MGTYLVLSVHVYIYGVSTVHMPRAWQAAWLGTVNGRATTGGIRARNIHTSTWTYFVEGHGALLEGFGATAHPFGPLHTPRQPAREAASPGGGQDGRTPGLAGWLAGWLAQAGCSLRADRPFSRRAVRHGMTEGAPVAPTWNPGAAEGSMQIGGGHLQSGSHHSPLTTHHSPLTLTTDHSPLTTHVVYISMYGPV